MGPVEFPVDIDGVELPHYATLDFAVCPISLVHEQILFRFIRVHALRLPFSSTSHRTVANLTREIVAQGRKPLTLVEWGTERSNYDDYDPVCSYEVAAGGWSDDVSKIVAAAQALPLITDAMINREFGEHRVVRQRALNRVQDGNAVFSSARVAKGTHPDHGDVIVFEMLVCASQRSKTYLVRVVFRRSDGKYLGTPDSMCICAVGSLFCAHVLCILLLIRVLQRASTLFPELTEAKVLALLPQSVLEVQQVLCPIDYLFGWAREHRERLVSKRAYELLDGVGGDGNDSDGVASDNDGADSDDGAEEAKSGESKTPVAVCEAVDMWAAKTVARGRIAQEEADDKDEELDPQHCVAVDGMRRATDEYVAKFPPDRDEQHVIDIGRERLFAKLKSKLLPCDTLEAYLAVSTAEERGERILEYRAHHDGRDSPAFRHSDDVMLGGGRAGVGDESSSEEELESDDEEEEPSTRPVVAVVAKPAVRKQRRCVVM